MDANIASGETPPGVESDNSKNAIMCAMCGKVENFFDAQDAGWEILENLEYICNECIAKKKATADDKKEGDNSKNALKKIYFEGDIEYNQKDDKSVEKARDEIYRRFQHAWKSLSHSIEGTSEAQRIQIEKEMDELEKKHEEVIENLYDY